MGLYVRNHKMRVTRREHAPTQHSITRSLVSFAQDTSFGNNSSFPSNTHNRERADVGTRIDALKVIYETRTQNTKSGGNLSKKNNGMNELQNTHAPLIIFATVAFGNESSSSIGGTPLAPSRSDI